MKSRALIVGIAVAVAAVAGAGVFLAARGPDPNAVPTAQQVADRTMSPFCPGLTLTECPTEKSVELRREIALRVADGSTNSDIDAWLVQAYGREVLGTPSGAVAWAVPALVVLGGAAALAWTLRRRTVGPADPGDPPTAAESLRLEEELREFTGGER